MNSFNSRASINSTARANVTTLEEGLALLNTLSDEQYSQGHRPAFQSTIGAHFRHFLEHYQCFFDQLESDVICYDTRQRDASLEQSKQHAVTIIDSILKKLHELNEAQASRQLLLKDEQIDAPISSNIQRELLFLQSHTVHHFAMIAAMARSIGVELAPDFGVAIQTRNFEQNSIRQSQVNLSSAVGE